MKNTSRRRLRSTSVQLGALTALALGLSACNTSSDDDCDRDRKKSSAAGQTVSTSNLVSVGALGVVAAAGPTVRAGQEGASADLPDRGGFGTHLASCGG